MVVVCGRWDATEGRGRERERGGRKRREGQMVSGERMEEGGRKTRTRFSPGVAGLLLRFRGLHPGLAAICRSRVT